MSVAVGLEIRGEEGKTGVGPKLLANSYKDFLVDRRVRISGCKVAKKFFHRRMTVEDIPVLTGNQGHSQGAIRRMLLVGALVETDSIVKTDINGFHPPPEL